MKTEPATSGACLAHGRAGAQKAKSRYIAEEFLKLAVSILNEQRPVTARRRREREALAE